MSVNKTTNCKHDEHAATPTTQFTPILPSMMHHITPFMDFVHLYTFQVDGIVVGVPVCEEMEEKCHRDVVALIVDIKFCKKWTFFSCFVDSSILTICELLGSRISSASSFGCRFFCLFTMVIPKQRVLVTALSHTFAAKSCQQHTQNLFLGWRLSS